MTAAVILTVIALLVVFALLSRQSSKSKKRASADLEQERQNVGVFDILELVKTEVRELGLTEIVGAENIPHGLLLKVWSASKDIVTGCTDRSHLRYIVEPGVLPSDATENDVFLECRDPDVDE
ncbi:MAG: hypothetical protein QGD89_01710 [Actinomycetota bacterium]|nr:hypothetical protein [Actinomycetota bacterium]